MQPLVKSEIESLSLVIVQKPGLSHDQMHPNHIKEYLANGKPNPEYLLFDYLIDTNLPETVRATNLVRLMRLMPEEWESFDQDLAELENAQKQIIKPGGNRAMLDKWCNY